MISLTLADAITLSDIIYAVFLLGLFMLAAVVVFAVVRRRNRDIDSSLEQNERIIELLEQISEKLDRKL